MKLVEGFDITRAAYNHYLGREPELAGLRNYFGFLDEGGTEEGMRAAFRIAPERAGVITASFRRVLHRDPRPDEIVLFSDTDFTAAEMDERVYEAAVASGEIPPIPPRPNLRGKIVFSSLACAFGIDVYGVVTGRQPAFALRRDELTRRLQFAQVHGATHTRMIPHSVWASQRADETPSPFAWTPSGWDLSAFDPWYFDAIREIARTANACGITLLVDLFDNCAQSGAWRSRSPWCVNRNGVDGIYDTKALPFHKAWVDRLLSAFGPLQVGYTLGNELADGSGADLQVAMMAFLKDRGIVPAWYGSMPPHWSDLARVVERAKRVWGADADRIAKCTHGMLSTGAQGTAPLVRTYPLPSDSLCISDDGEKQGDDAAPPDQGDNGRPSAAQFVNRIDVVDRGHGLSWDSFWIEHLPENIPGADLDARVQAPKLDAIRARLAG